MPDSARIRGRSGDSPDFSSRNFDKSSLSETYVVKYVPLLLSQQKKEFRAADEQDFLGIAKSDPDFSKRAQLEMSRKFIAMTRNKSPVFPV